MKDFLGKPLEIGDYVVMMEPRYRNYKLAHIVSFTPQKVRVEYVRTNSGSRQTDTLLQESYQLVKVTEADATWQKLINPNK